MKYLLVISLVICGCLAANDKEIYSVSVPDGASGIGDTIKRFLEEHFRKIKALPEILPMHIGTPIDIGNMTLTINSGNLNGLADMFSEVEISMALLKGKFIVGAGWKDDVRGKIELDFKIDIKDPNSKLAFLAGPGAIDIAIINSYVAYNAKLIKMKVKEPTFDFVVDKDMKINRFVIGGNDLGKVLDNLIHEEDVYNIVTILGNDVISAVLNCALSLGNPAKCEGLIQSYLDSFHIVGQRLLQQ